MQLQKHPLSFIHKIKSLLSTTSFLSCSPTAQNTTVSLDKLTFTDYEDFGKCEYRFGKFSWSKNDSNYLDVKLTVFKKGDSKELRLGPKSYTEKNRYQPVYAIEESVGRCSRKHC